MKKIFMNPFKKETCPKCNKEVKKLNHNTMSSKEVHFTCSDCEITVEIQSQANASNNRHVCIKFDQMHFYLYEDNEIMISKNSERGAYYKRELVIENTFMDLSELKSIKEAYNFCLKVKDNLLFL